MTISEGLQRADGALRGVPLVRTYTQALVSEDAPRIYGTLWAGAWFVLVIACANLTNLLLVRTTGRWRECSTRLALGAGPWRLARQMLIESLALTGVAAAVASWLTVRAVSLWAETTASRYLVLDYSVTRETFAYLFAIALGAGVAITLLPISRLRQFGVLESLKGEARGSTQGRRARRLTATLVGAQMALALVLLLGAGVLVRSFQNIVGASTGVRGAERIATGLVGLPSDTYASGAARAAYFERLLTRLRAVPGAEAVSMANTVPTRGLQRWPIEIDGRARPPESPETAMIMRVAPGYFAAMGRTGIAGRDFLASDDGLAPRVVMVNERFAADAWPGQPAVGRRLRLLDQDAPGAWRTVVGVTPDIMQGDATRQTFRPLIYVPVAEQPSSRAFVFLRSSRPVADAVRAIRDTAAALDADVTIEELSSVEATFAFDRDWMDWSTPTSASTRSSPRCSRWWRSCCRHWGWWRSSRTRSASARGRLACAWRLALPRTTSRGWSSLKGCAPWSWVSSPGWRWPRCPIACCSPSSSVCRPTTSVTLMAGPLALLAAAAAGCRLPARRASRVDPMVALRHE
ncbi:MAG: FtsX-like permease family protein [Vicinamibacterales bacterium]